MEGGVSPSTHCPQTTHTGAQAQRGGRPSRRCSQPASAWVRPSGTMQDHQLPDVCSSGVTQMRPVQTADPQNLRQAKPADSKSSMKPHLLRKSCHTPLHTLTYLLLYTSLLPKKNHTVCQLIPPSSVLSLLLFNGHTLYLHNQTVSNPGQRIYAQPEFNQ